MLGSSVAGEARRALPLAVPVQHWQAMIASDGYISIQDYADLATWLADLTDFVGAMMARSEIATVSRPV